jgi:hypothetical protein
MCTADDAECVTKIMIDASVERVGVRGDDARAHKCRKDDIPTRGDS